jgi:uncharacterized protein YcfJ
MNKPTLTGTVLGALLATAGVAGASYTLFNKQPDRADVISVRQLTETVKTPREACHEEQVTRQRPVQDEHRVAGTAIGALVGGVLGNQVGGGSGRTLATVAGATAGGYAGNQVQQRMQHGDTYTTTERRCATVYDSRETVVGYEVRYRLDGRESVVRMDHDPGDHIPVRDGRLVLAKQPEAGRS